MGKLLAFLLLLLVSIPVALLRGVVLADMIDWFTPYTVTIVQAVGLSFIVAMFTISLKRENYAKDEGDNVANMVGHLISSVLTTLVLWLFAYIWSLFL